MKTCSTISPTPSRRPMLLSALLACYLIWGTTYLAIRIALGSFPPFLQMGTRFLAAGGLLMLWVWWRRSPLPTGREWRHALLAGGLMLGGGMGLTACAETRLGSGLVAAFVAVVPLQISAWQAVLGRRPSRGEAAGMGLGLLGMLLLTHGEGFAASPQGLLCISGATLCWSLGSVLSGGSAARFPLADGVAGYASQMLCGGALLLLLSTALGEGLTRPITAAAWGAWVYLVLAGSLVAFSAYRYLLKWASPSLASSYAFVNPVVALALGAGLAGEAVRSADWLACGLVLAGVLCLWKKA